MLKVGDKLICGPSTGEETEFSIRATVIEIQNDLVTVDRFLKFGTLPVGRTLSLPEEELLKYYKKVDK